MVPQEQIHHLCHMVIQIFLITLNDYVTYVHRIIAHKIHVSQANSFLQTHFKKNLQIQLHLQFLLEVVHFFMSSKSLIPTY